MKRILLFTLLGLLVRWLGAEQNPLEAGDQEPEPVPLRVSLIPDLQYPFQSPIVHGLSLNMPLGRARTVRGFELGLLLNLVTEEMAGAQLAGVGNILDGELLGAQQAGLFNLVSGKARGVQVAGLFNRADSVSGVQIGLINVATSVQGVQLGLVNIAGDAVQGAQIGPLNVAGGRVTGSQIGPFNMAQELQGPPLGLLNLNRSGLHLSSWITEIGTAYLGVQTGSRHLYTLLYGGIPMGEPWAAAAAGLGMGLHIPVGPIYVNVDLSAKFLRDESASESDTRRWSSPFPSIRILTGFSILPWLSLFGGALMDGQLNGNVGETAFHRGPVIDIQLWDGNLRLYTKLFLGLRL